MGDIVFRVRSGLGTVYFDGTFNDTLETEARTPRQHKGWQSVTYKGKRYALRGGVRTDYFICLNNPLGKKA